MLFFNKKQKLIDTGILNGAVDWHCHILPGVDDGVAKMDDSLEVLSYYEEIGIREVWLTPHIMEDIPNTTDELRNRYDELRAAYNGSVKLNLAAENMIDNLFIERLENDDFLTIGDKGQYLLVETSYFQPPIDFYKTLKLIKEKGYSPILAHPERYGYMEENAYDYLISMGVKLQMNLMSLVGAYGKAAQEKAVNILSKGYYSFFGSDLHRLKAFQGAINEKALKKDVVEKLQGIPNFIV
ncbi:MAG: capsular biosynthesis protein [Bacteroidaceae bacterium]|nr:capsular biosynthesis protein [Bacteroidaceae bacterium]